MAPHYRATGPVVNRYDVGWRDVHWHIVFRARAHYSAAMRDIPQIPYATALLLLGGIGPVAAAFYAQYMLGFPPCPLCLWQRYPYLLPALSGVALLVPPMRRHWRALLAMGILGWLITGGIGAYHVAFEQGWVAGDTGCAAAKVAGTLSDLRASILEAPLVACNVVSFRFLTLSMASWNVMGTLAMIALAIGLLRRRP
jgi:disulfide bond formation protein DsbB